MLLNKMLGIRYPIIGGAMANITDGKFAASVSNAGALGIIAGGGWDGNRIRDEIRIAKSLTDKPFGVNIMLMSPYADEIADVIIEEGVKIVTTGAGSPGKYMPRFKEAGIQVFPVCASVVLAKRMERYGISGIIAEGTESGGHVGEATTMSLLPQMVKELHVPVIAAGGIATGSQLYACLAMGAVGIQVGTVLLASNECPIHENYKLAVLHARDNDTVVTGRSIGAPVRILKNEMSKEYLDLERNVASRDELEAITIGALRKAVYDGDMIRGSVMMGQIAGIIDEILPLNVIFERLMSDAKEAQMNVMEKMKEIGE